MQTSGSTAERTIWKGMTCNGAAQNGHHPVIVGGAPYFFSMNEVAMNCIDAIEGTVKSIIDRLHVMYIQERLDDSEYIRCIKSVINATETYVQGQEEIAAEPNVLKNRLYAYSKALWLARQAVEQSASRAANGNVVVIQPNDGYQDYYYDYIYSHGLYPR